MDCILKGKHNKLKTNGILRKEENNYYIYIELKENDPRENNYEIIYSYDEESKKVTLVNCYFIASNHIRENDVAIYKYKVNYVIDGWIENIHSNSIKQIYLYFYELDRVFIKEQIKENLSKNGLKITANKTIIHLYENDKLKIEVYKLPSMTDSRNKATIATPAKIVITFKEKKLEYGDIFEYVRKIENIFGFIVGDKLNLISMEIFDDNFRKIRYRYLKEKKLCKDNEADLTDIHSVKLIKQLVKRYFEDKVYKNVIPRNVKLSEAPSYGMPITLYDPRSKGAKSYEKFTREFLKINEEEQKAAKHMKKGE